MRFLSVQVFTAAAAALAVRQNAELTDSSIAADLNALLTPGATAKVELRARWSEYNDPRPATVVSVSNEKDVAEVVSLTIFCF